MRKVTLRCTDEHTAEQFAHYLRQDDPSGVRRDGTQVTFPVAVWPYFGMVVRHALAEGWGDGGMRLGALLVLAQHGVSEEVLDA